MSGINSPNDTKAVNPGSGFWTPVWLAFQRAVANRLNSASQVAEVTTAVASDLATAITLVNVLRTTVNELSAAMREE